MLRIEIREQRVGDSYPLRTWCCQFMTRCAQSAEFQSNMWLNTTVQISRKPLNVWSDCALCRVAFGATQYQMEPNYEFIVTMQLLFFARSGYMVFVQLRQDPEDISQKRWPSDFHTASWVPATPFLNDTEPLGKRASCQKSNDGLAGSWRFYRYLWVIAIPMMTKNQYPSRNSPLPGSPFGSPGRHFGRVHWGRGGLPTTARCEDREDLKPSGGNMAGFPIGKTWFCSYGIINARYAESVC